MFGGAENCKIDPSGARSKAPLCDHWITRITVLNPAGGMDISLLWEADVSVTV
jgi:hypothetical protein